ncbi:MAG: hypothetical protein M0037_09615 [Betaproteobacteria bacterium]|nr:hypothetical protein [Betaproteobacteria bacterium]
MPIPDFSDAELWVINSALKERYGHAVEVQLADSELRLYPEDRELTVCPTVYWNERGAGFVLCKVAESRYRCYFFYSVREQFGTGRDDYDDLAECVTTLLRLQADHEQKRAGVTSGKTGRDLG